MEFVHGDIALSVRNVPFFSTYGTRVTASARVHHVLLCVRACCHSTPVLLRARTEYSAWNYTIKNGTTLCPAIHRAVGNRVEFFGRIIYVRYYLRNWCSSNGAGRRFWGARTRPSPNHWGLKGSFKRYRMGSCVCVSVSKFHSIGTLLIYYYYYMIILKPVLLTCPWYTRARVQVLLFTFDYSIPTGVWRNTVNRSN